MLVHEFLNKNPDIVPYEAPILLYSNSSVCTANNGKVPSTQGTFLEEYIL